MSTLSQFLTQRAISAHGMCQYVQPPHPFLATVYDDPELHTQHVLPGAKRAITHVELHKWQDEGLLEHEMVAVVNARWDEANRSRVTVFEAWRDGEQAEHVRGFVDRQAARAQALAEFERSFR